MNTRKLKLITVFCFLISQLTFSIHANSRTAPDVTFDKVKPIFGFNLDSEDPTLRNLLLAISMDHTSEKSPYADQNIGIPFIVDREPDYWAGRLAEDEKWETEVLVNNALLLLFADQNIPNAKEHAMKLMQGAAAQGYWPADFYIADMNIRNVLSRNTSEFRVVNGSFEMSKYQDIAQDTITRLNNCAAVGFAPCQFRIGFWLSGSEKTLSDGITVLRAAIQTTLKDKRYTGILENYIAQASNIIISKGAEVGIDSVIRGEYQRLMEEQVNIIAERVRG